MARRRKNVSFLRLMFDLLMIIFTGGLWLIWLIVRFLRTNS